jgi:nucleotide-binding universal stress UspA family protein
VLGQTPAEAGPPRRRAGAARSNISDLGLGDVVPILIWGSAAHWRSGWPQRPRLIPPGDRLHIGLHFKGRRRPYTGWQMSAYQTVVVGTDGSDSSMRAVDRAAAIAADHGAKLIVATAHPPASEEHGGWSVPPGSTHGKDYRTVGDAPIYAILQDARERAHKAGAQDVEEKPIVGAPINALVQLAEDVHADLLVVGNVGLSSVAGRLLGSVPSAVSRKAKTDVLIVHTTD